MWFYTRISPASPPKDVALLVVLTQRTFQYGTLASQYDLWREPRWDSEATVGVPKWGSGDGDNGILNPREGSVSDGLNARILGSSDSKGHRRPEYGPSKDSYTGFPTDGKDHLLDCHCQVVFRSETTNSEVLYYLAPFSSSSVTTASCSILTASESGV